MTPLLAVDGLPYRLLSGWVALMRASLVWVLFSLPLVTAPAAVVVLIHTVRRVFAGEPPPGVGESWRMVRANLWQALALAGLVAAGSFVVVSALLGPSPGGVFDVILPVVAIPVAATWFLACQWSFAVIEERRDGALAALRYAYLRAIRRLDLAVVSLLGTIALLLAGLALPAAVWIPYWIVAPSLWATLVSATSRRARQKGDQS
jgi:hypothetical protein